MMPQMRSTRSGATSANSTAAAPASPVRLIAPLSPLVCIAFTELLVSPAPHAAGSEVEPRDGKPTREHRAHGERDTVRQNLGRAAGERLRDTPVPECAGPQREAHGERAESAATREHAEREHATRERGKRGRLDHA